MCEQHLVLSKKDGGCFGAHMMQIKISFEMRVILGVDYTYLSMYLRVGTLILFI